MHVRTAVAGGLLALTAALGVAGAAPAAAQEACDAYSGGCTEPPRVLPTTVTRGSAGTAVSPTAETPSTLPFTGGEVVLLSALGAAAVAGGTALVVAGRRRSA